MGGLTGARDIYEKEKIKKTMMLAALYSARIHCWNFPTGFLEIHGTANFSLGTSSCDGLSVCLADLELQAAAQNHFPSLFRSSQVGTGSCIVPSPTSPDDSNTCWNLRITANRKLQLLLLKMMVIFKFRFKFQLFVSLHWHHSKEW